MKCLKFPQGQFFYHLFLVFSPLSWSIRCSPSESTMRELERRRPMALVAVDTHQRADLPQMLDVESLHRRRFTMNLSEHFTYNIF